MAEWTAVKEEELKQATRAAAWRWIAYVLTVIGLGVGFLGGVIIEAISPGDGESAVIVGWVLAGMILLLAIFLDVPAEKAAKKMKLLKVEKASSIQFRT